MACFGLPKYYSLKPQATYGRVKTKRTTGLFQLKRVEKHDFDPSEETQGTAQYSWKTSS